MLRIIVISLFVANLLLLGFQKDNPVVQPETAATGSEVKDSAIPTIHLFSEMIEDQGLLSGSRRCFSLGPFHAIEDQEEIRTRLQEVSTSISERQTEALVEKGYWVFMPPYTSLLEANEEVISLQALGLEDISVVYSGDWKNAISLGYFMRQENALRRKKNLEDRGYAPLMRVQRQAEPRYWLEYEQSPGSALITLDMQNRPNDFMQRVLPCPEQEVFEVAGVDSQDLVEELAQQQTPEEENDLDPGEGADLAEFTESTTQEAVEPVPRGAGESEGGVEDGAAESVEDAMQDNIEAPTEPAIETVPEITGEAASAELQDAAEGKENKPIESAGALLDQVIDAVPETSSEMGSNEEADIANGKENTPQDAVEISTDAAIEADPESNGEEAGVTNGIENMPPDAVETSTDAAMDTDPESNGEAGTSEEADPVEDSQNTPQENVEALSSKTVGTGPEWYGQPEASEETDATEGIENVSVEDKEGLLNPGIETESETTGGSGTGEG